MERKMVLSVAVVAILLIAAVGYFYSTEEAPGPVSEKAPVAAMPPGVVWDDVYKFSKQGYEPSLVVDSKGYMYYTAHKNLDDKSTWDYLASWFFVGSPDGKSWVSPSDPPIRGQKWKTELGDEGDLAIDANDRVYYVDTYLIDNHLHVFDSPGTWQYSVRVQKTTGLDDRPWIAAQGNGICHYLGNNAAEVNGGRYWYYRSTDGGRVWTLATPVPGNGWAHIDAETKGTHAYVIDEGDTGVPADILVYANSDSGAGWSFSSPVVVGQRSGPGLGDGFPVWISAGTDGTVWCMWVDADDAMTNGSRIFLGWSFDYGQNWNSSEVTPWKGLFEYTTIDVGDDGTIGIAFYVTETLPVTADTEWYLYGAMLRPSSPYHPANPAFNKTGSAMREYKQYVAKHSDNPDNITGQNSTLFFNFTRGEQGPAYTGTDLHALHDFFEIAVGPDGYIDVAYQHYVGPTNGASELYFVRGNLGQGNMTLPMRNG